VDPKDEPKKKELAEAKKKEIAEAHKAVHLSDVDRELLIRWILKDYRFSSRRRAHHCSSAALILKSVQSDNIGRISRLGLIRPI